MLEPVAEITYKHTGNGAYTGEWVRKYPPEKLVNLITENLEI